jgi:hypothetical protein
MSTLMDELSQMAAARRAIRGGRGKLPGLLILEIKPWMSLMPAVPKMELRVERKHQAGDEQEPGMDPEMGVPGLSSEMETSRATRHTSLVACGGELVLQWKQPR